MIGNLMLLFSLSSNPSLPIESLNVAEGYKISVVARASNVRQLALSAEGTLFAGSRRAGQVYAFIDKNNDGIYEETRIIASNLNMPSGIAIKENDLYVAEVDRILKFSNILPLPAQTSPQYEVYFNNLPKDRHHGWKYLKFGPDHSLYFNIGAPCNICDPAPPFASIVKLGSNKSLSLVAKGVRNSVGFDWHPLSNNLWFTDNGRDHLGDNLPSDELNHAHKAGLHFGYPFIHGKNTKDPQFSTSLPINHTPPSYLLGAHVAPLGMVFIKEQSSENRDTQTLFIAEHGSWNRSKKVGYRVVKLTIKNDQVLTHQPFISGWLKGEEHWGRPNDIIVDPDGSLLISDDYAGAIYRVSKH